MLNRPRSNARPKVALLVFCIVPPKCPSVVERTRRVHTPHRGLRRHQCICTKGCANDAFISGLRLEEHVFSLGVGRRGRKAYRDASAGSVRAYRGWAPAPPPSVFGWRHPDGLISVLHRPGSGWPLGRMFASHPGLDEILHSGVLLQVQHAPAQMRRGPLIQRIGDKLLAECL